MQSISMILNKECCQRRNLIIKIAKIPRKLS